MTFEVMSIGSQEEERKSPGFEIVSMPSEQSEPGSIGKTAAISAKAISSPIAGGYGDIQGLLLSLTSKAFGVDPERVRQKLQSIAEEDTETPYMAPSTEEVKNVIESIAPSSKPTTSAEKTLEETLELGSTLANPLLGPVKPIRAAIGTAAGIGSKLATEYLGFGETAQEAAKNISSVLPMILSGKITPTTQESKQLYDAGIRAGLSEAELTPLLASDRRLKTIGKLAKSSPKVSERMQNIEGGLSNFYKSIKREAGELPSYTKDQTKKLIDKMEDVSSSWKKTLKAAPDKAEAIKYLDESISKLKTEGASPESLVNYYQDINAAVNWRAIKGGKKELAEVKEVIKESLRESSPKLARDFDDANKLWSKMENFRRGIGFGETEKYLELGKFAPLLYGISTFDLPTITKTLGGIISAESARKIATELMINPNWQHITRNTMLAASKDSPKVAAIAYKQLKDKVREDFPSDYKNIDWP